MYMAGYIVAGFLVAGVYATRLAARQAAALPAGGLTSRSRGGDRRARAALRGRLGGARGGEQAAREARGIEGLQRRHDRARRSTSFGWYNERTRTSYGIEIPDLLSLLAYHDPDATVEGLERRADPDDRRRSTSCGSPSRPWSSSGRSWRCSASSTSVSVWRRRKLPESPWFFRAVVAAGPLAVVALICGWVTTEVGRQPWIVYGVMRTEEAVTGAEGVPIGYATLVVVYLGLATIAGVDAAPPRAHGRWRSRS